MIAATNVVPGEAVKSGKLREDLYYRLHVFAIELPPLRQRKEDLPLLIQSFIGEFNSRNNNAVSAVEPAAMKVLEHYHWPGNVRELRNVTERAVILSSGEFLEMKHLPPYLTETPAPAAPTGGMALTPGMTVEEAENRLIVPDARALWREQDARRRDSRDQPEDAAQQVEQNAWPRLGRKRYRPKVSCV
jgi:transcriptional regulator with PAS, ATPase and Fis domain